jgi:hypothetical protein
MRRLLIVRRRVASETAGVFCWDWESLPGQLIGFSDAPLDVALFTVPAGYRPALPGLFGGYDLTKPDTVMNRLQSYWDGLRAWADGRLRSVWRK